MHVPAVSKRLVALALAAILSLSCCCASCAFHFSSGWQRATLTPRATFSLQASPQDEVEKLKEQAEKLRNDIDSFEEKKRLAEDKERRKLEAELAEKEALRDRYSAVVPILKPDGNTEEERVDFPPFRKEGSYITVCEAALPLGTILGESEEFVRAISVDEVASGSNGEAAGIRVGDLIRGFTACQMQMEQPAWQLMAGGIGRPKLFRLMYSPDGRPFEEVMDAVASNRMDPAGRPVLIVLERKL